MSSDRSKEKKNRGFLIFSKSVEKKDAAEILLGKYKSVGMMVGVPSSDDDIETKNWQKRFIEVAKYDGDYKGLFTTGLSYCTAVTVLEAKEGGVNRIMMAHLQGGVSEEGFQRLKEKMDDVGFSKSLKLRIIVSPGTDPQYSLRENVESAVKNLAKFYKIQSVSITPGATSRYVNFDGSTGPFLSNAIAQKDKDFIVSSQNLSPKKRPG